MKASEKQSLCKKVVTVLKRRYKKKPPKNERSVLETLLYGICLEDQPAATADAAYARLLQRFHDLNELRVSSLSEIETVFSGLDYPEYRALRVRSALQNVFEKSYAFDLESLRKKTLEAAARRLAAIPYLTEFVRTYTLQQALQAHLLPLDARMRNAAAWLGLVSYEDSPAEAAESLKAAIRKSDAPLLCHLLRCFATDPAFARKLETAGKKPPAEGFDPDSAIARLTELIDSAGKSTRKKTPRKTARKTAPRKSAAGKTAARKTGTRKTATKKKTKRSAAAGRTKTAAKKRTKKKSSPRSR